MLYYLLCFPQFLIWFAVGAILLVPFLFGMAVFVYPVLVYAVLRLQDALRS